MINIICLITIGGILQPITGQFRHNQATFHDLLNSIHKSTDILDSYDLLDRRASRQRRVGDLILVPPYSVLRQHDQPSSVVNDDKISELDCQPDAKIKLVLVIDGSSSVTPMHFASMKKFLENLVEMLPDTGLQIAGLQYGLTARWEFRFDDFSEKATIREAIKQMKYLNSGWTFTVNALNVTAEYLSKRKEKAMILVVTDGNAADWSDEVDDVIKQLHDWANGIFVIGVGPHINRKQISKIAKARENIFTLDDFVKLGDAMAKRVVTAVCKQVLVREKDSKEVIQQSSPLQEPSNTIPVIIEGPSDLNVTLGKPFTLEAIVEGQDFKIEWYKNGVKEGAQQSPPSALYRKQWPFSFKILESDYKDSGAYEIRAFNKLGIASAGANVLVEGKAPKLIEPPKDVSVKLGQTAELSITADGGPLMIEIYKDEILLEHIASYEPGLVSHVFTIPEVSLDNAGEYIVKLSNEHGDVARRVNLFVSGPKPEIVKGPDGLTILAGLNAEFDAQISGYPYSIFWKHNNRLITDALMEAVPGSAKLTIFNVRPEDAGDYQLLVQNDFGSDKRDFVLVVEEEKVTEPLPEISSSSSTLTVYEDENATFSALIEGNSGSSRIIWLKDGNILKIENNTGVALSKHVYSIPRVKLTDSGIYSLRVENTAGHDQQSYKLQVLPAEVPIIVSGLSNVTVYLHQAAEMSLTVKGGPYWIQWSLHPSILHPDVNLGSSDPDSSSPNQFIAPKKWFANGLETHTLSIPRMLPEDTGVISAVIWNDAGLAQSRAVLRIHNDGKPIVSKLTERTANVGDDVEFSINISNAPYVIQWFKGNTLAKGSENDGGDGTIFEERFVLPQVSQSDAGVYSVAVWNKYGRLTESAALKVVEKKPKNVVRLEINMDKAESIFTCNSVDLIVVLDGSSSIGLDNFESIKKFLKGLVLRFPEGTRMGLLQYGIRAEWEFKMGDFTRKEDINGAIQALKYMNSTTTRTIHAINVSLDALSLDAHPSSTALLLVTDGNSKDWHLGGNRVVKVLQSRVTPWVIGIGSQLNRTQLEMIAGSEARVQVENGFAGFNNQLASSLSRKICTTGKRLNAFRAMRPRILSGLQCMMADDGDQVVFQVQAEGAPYVLTWYLNDVFQSQSVITEDPPDHVIKLTIPGITPVNEGTYRVVLDNEYGYAESTAEVVVETLKQRRTN